MSLRNYFDAGMRRNGAAPAADRGRTAGTMTTKSGAAAAKHIAQAKQSLSKIKAHQERRRKESARATA